MIKSLIKWHRRNFGYVYLSTADHPGILWRFKARRGRVALCWSTLGGTIPFVCRLSPDGRVLIDKKELAGYGKQYGDWTWRYFYPMGFPLENIRTGGYWS